MRLFSAICLLLLLPVAEGYAQQGQLFFKHFTVGQGLPSNEVHGLYEDDHGFLWITTDRGIVRYDGYNFEEMHVEGMPAVFPWFGIYKDPLSDKIYFTGMQAQLAVYEHGRLKAYSYNDRLRDSYGDNYYTISSFASRNDSLWIGLDLVGVLLITPDGEIIRRPEATGIHFNVQKRTHKRWVGKPVNESKQRIVLYINWGDKQTMDTVFMSEPTRTEWLSAGAHDLFFCGEQLLVFSSGIKIAVHDLPHSVHSVCMIEQRRALIGFKNGGGVLYHLTGEDMYPEKEMVWLPDLTVTNIRKDKQGGIWVATAENGLYYAYPSRAGVWAGKGKISVLQKHAGKVYVGGQSEAIEVYADGMLRKTIQKISKPGPDGRGTGMEMERIVKTIGRDYHPDDPEYVDPIFLISNMRFTGGGGLPEFMYKKLLQKMPDHISSQLISHKITSMLEDQEGRLWIGTYAGLYVYEHGQLSLFGADDAYKHVFSDRIVQLMFTGNGNMVVATLGSGLGILKGKHILRVLNKDNGLNTTIINNTEVQGDTIWLATNNGISKLFPKADSFSIVHYGTPWGLPSPAIYELLVCGDWIYFRWIDQLVTIHKGLLANRLLPSGIPVITTVTINGKLQDSLYEGLLHHDQKEVKITFNSVNLANGPNQLYRYTLRGGDEKWYYTTGREAVFTNLSPGNYVFVLQVADAHGVFLPGVAEYSFKVLPAFWQRWWFPFVIGLLLLLLAYLYYRSRLQVIKRNNQVMLELAENQQKALVQLINPHFIFNVLNTAQAAILKENKMTAASIISRFAKLMRLSLELSRNQFVLLSQETELLQRYIELEMIRMPGKFVYHLSVADNVDAGHVRIPGMLVQPFVENAIKHGIMHLIDKTGEIYIHFYREGMSLICKVADNGIGREEAARINKSRVQNHHSVGIEITCRRLKLLHRERGTDYYYHVVDKYDKENIPLGTEVIFSVPYNI